MLIADVMAALNAQMRKQSNLHWAALVDGAFDYPSAWHAPYASEGINCYQIDTCEGLQDAAPWLMPLASNGTNQALLERLLRHCSEHPMLSFVASREPTINLKKYWENLHWVSTDDGQRMLLRMADTRILPILPQVLTSTQWAAFTTPLACWLYINRYGQLVSCSLEPEETPVSVPIRLSQLQLDRLLNAAETDAVFNLVTERMADIIPAGMNPIQLYHLIEESCLLAQAHQIEIYSDTVALAVAACLSCGQSTRNPTLLALLRARQWIAGKLAEALIEENII